MLDSTILTRSVPGVDRPRAERLAEDLNRNLASLVDLAAAFKQAHWNVAGRDFSQCTCCLISSRTRPVSTSI